ncbi:hypothetical protein [uncultured Amphritea sp.]|uniref:hypothetical protein n=1 Tax=Amphritea sp. TaxID=1872502 RepID=UPI0025F7BC1A|nr:hypothetical protein [uncultured Amphritea sp.]
MPSAKGCLIGPGAVCRSEVDAGMPCYLHGVILSVSANNPVADSGGVFHSIHISLAEGPTQLLLSDAQQV